MTRYWCHACNEAVTINNPNPNDDVACPKCGSEFIEEYEDPAPQQSQPPPPPPPSQSSTSPSPNEPTPTVDPFAQNIFSLFNTITARQQRNRSSQPQSPNQQQQQQQPQQQRPGISFRVINYNSSGVPVSVSTATFGNGIPGIPILNPNGLQPLFNLFGAPEMYRVDGREMTFDELLSHLFQASKAKGTPPASKEAVEKLRTIKVTQEHVDAEIGCAVCQEPLAVGEEVTELPCKHLYHHDCITPWLKMHNSCPECRYELPTDDADYEKEKKEKAEKQEREKREKEEKERKEKEEEEEEKKKRTEMESEDEPEASSTSTNPQRNNNNRNDDDDDDDDGNSYDSFYI